MHVPPFHQAKHFAGQPAHLQGLAVELTGEWIQGAHDVGDSAIAVRRGMRGGSSFRFGENPGICLLYHLLAEIHAHQVVLKDVVVEHVLRSLAQVQYPFAQWRGFDAKGHVLGIDSAGRVIIPADSADPAGDEMSVARILPLHEYAVTAEDRGRAVTLGDFPIVKVNFRENAEAPHDPSNRIPIHIDQIPLFAGTVYTGLQCGSHGIVFLSSVGMRSIACRESRTGMAPFRFFVYGRIRDPAESADHPAIATNNSCGKAGAWRLVHEGHELVGKARHRAAYADSTDIRATADARASSRVSSRYN